MKQDWILHKKETKRIYSKATWIPLRASCDDSHGDIKDIGYTSDFFGCGSAAFPPKNREIAEEFGWMEIGLSKDIEPYAYDDGYYSSIEQYQYNDKEPIGVQLVFEHPQPVVGGRLWILNPDLIVALRLIKEGNNWVRPQENFIVVARELFNEEGEHHLIEIKREFLIDYLAARNLSLRLSYYHQRVENVDTLIGSEYEHLTNNQEERDGGQFELRINNLNDIYGGSWSSFRVWRTDVDEDEDAPVMTPENNDNTDYESSQGYIDGYSGVRIEGEFWRNEWIDHQGESKRVRGDIDINLPQFIVDTDGTPMPSADLKKEYIGRWLWFRPSVINDFLSLRGFSFKWYTSETGGIYSTSGYTIHFGINSSDLITIYAYDIARLPSWEQHIWAAYNIAPDGKVSKELLLSQVEAQPAATHAVEELLFNVIDMLETGFHEKFSIAIFSHNIDKDKIIQQISRFSCKDQASLLKLAKELIRIFSDRINVSEIRKLSTRKDKEKLGSNKLLEDLLAQKIGLDDARKIFTPIVGIYDMRVGDSHPTSSKINDAIKLAGIDESKSYLRQGEQLILNFGQSIWFIGKYLFDKLEK